MQSLWVSGSGCSSRRAAGLGIGFRPLASWLKGCYRTDARRSLSSSSATPLRVRVLPGDRVGPRRRGPPRLEPLPAASRAEVAGAPPWYVSVRLPRTEIEDAKQYTASVTSPANRRQLERLHRASRGTLTDRQSARQRSRPEPHFTVELRLFGFREDVEAEAERSSSCAQANAAAGPPFGISTRAQQHPRRSRGAGLWVLEPRGNRARNLTPTAGRFENSTDVPPTLAHASSGNELHDQPSARPASRSPRGWTDRRSRSGA